MRYCFLPVLSVCILLSGCGPSREEADARLAEACLAAVKVMNADSTVIEIDQKSFAKDEATGGTQLRVVTLETRISVDHGVWNQRKISCAFDEEISAFGLSYSAKLFNMDLGDGRKYGNFGGSVTGDYNDMARIFKAVDDVLLK